MRKYEAIWVQLKATSNCKIVAHPSLHARIKKAVTKEKYNDTAYKVQWDLEGTELPTLEIALDVDASGHKIKNVLVFRLIKPVLLGEL